MKPAVLFALSSLALWGQTPVRYELRFPNAVHHEAEVRVTFSGVKKPVLEVVMSRSSPGRYALHEFAKNVYAFRASDGQGRSLAVAQPSPYQWNVSSPGGTVVVEYTLYGDRAEGTYVAIDRTHAHLNLPATLVWARGFEKSPAALRFFPPEGWQVATQLAPGPDGSWAAPNLDRLLDSPVELSAHALYQWQEGAARFRVALHHQGTGDEGAKYADLIHRVTREAAAVFGAFPKFDNGTYTFLIDYLPYVVRDGMEHRNSTVVTHPLALKDSALDLLSTVSHEFFHIWNVKRIRPKTLEPFDFERVNVSGELWFAEGFTNYYGPLVLTRSGLHDLQRFNTTMSSAVSTVLTAPGREVHNVI